MNPHYKVQIIRSEDMEAELNAFLAKGYATDLVVPSGEGLYLVIFVYNPALA